MKKQSVKTGLACAGGVVEGAIYEIGALCALEEAIEGLDFNAMDVYVGVSSGALITSALANGVAPRTLSEALLSKADPILNLKPEVLFTPALAEYGNRLLKLPVLVRDALWRYAKNPRDLSVMGMLADLNKLVPVGIFDNEPIHDYLAGVFSSEGRTNDFRELDACLRVVTVNLDSSEVVVFGEPETAHVPISKAVQASTALPGLYCPVEIEGSYYIDGVARRTVHASRALEAGAELLFCINPIVPVDMSAATDEYAGHSLVEQGLPAVMSQTFRTLVHSRMRTGFKNYEHTYPDAEVVIIEPDMEDHDVFFSNIFSLSNRSAVCEHAYAATRTYLLDHAEEIVPKLEKHGFHLRMDVLQDATRTLFPGTILRDADATPLVRASNELGDTIDRLDAVLERLQLPQPESID